MCFFVAKDMIPQTMIKYIAQAQKQWVLKYLESTLDTIRFHQKNFV